MGGDMAISHWFGNSTTTLVYAGLVLTLAGCTRSINVAYQTGAARLPIASPEKATLGVAKFDDKRTWVDKEDPKSGSYVAQARNWRFGITHDEKEYTPVADLIQKILLTELTNAGFSVKGVDRVLSKQNKQEIIKLEDQNRFDYLLGGEILVFEFVNEEGFWTITSRRAATISLVLVRTKDGENTIDKLFSESQREGEGIGVLHSTNVDKLVNGVFKKVAGQIVQEVAMKLGLDSKNVSMRLSYDGAEFELAKRGE
jgi:hypothetical protein